jgi:2-C-methyl-D-erythritol 4-phosphate cytidylyltransferase/2-C-methyl-D-erythritol 2,4-cyclodiphosphate synthase
MTTAVIIVAAGSGTRLGLNRPKAFIDVGGRSLAQRAIDAVRSADSTAQIILVVPVGHAGEHPGVSVVTGGATRHESVGAGLAALADDVEIVLVHDAARALASPHLITRVIEEVRSSGAGIVPALAISDAIKRVDDNGNVAESVDRSVLAAVQTPQGFPRAELEAAYASIVADDHNDDAAVYIFSGRRVHTIPGEANAFKITTLPDLERAHAIISGAAGGHRVGSGTDVHAFGPDRGLWLAGLNWPEEFELAGHSDGDSASHAIVDALLCAAGLGDIGAMVGTDDPAFENAHGEVFIREAVARVRAAGFEPINVTVQILGNRPKLAPRRAEAERVLSQWVGAPVSVSATTTDGLGLMGEGKGIAATATALIKSVVE